MNQSTDITGATCSKTEPHESHPIVGSFRGSCSGVNRDESPAPVHAFNRDIYAASAAGACGGQGWRSGDKNAVTCPECKEILAQRVQTPEETEADIAALPPNQSAQDDVPDRRPERNKCGHGFWIQGGIETCPDGCTKTLADKTEQWIAEQVGHLSENELMLVKTVLDEIRAGRPVEHFMPGTKVYVDSWGTAEFIVQGTAPWFDEHGVPHRKVEIKSAAGGLSGHVHPSELRRVPPYAPVLSCTCPLGPEDAHFPDCPMYVAR